MSALSAPRARAPQERRAPRLRVVDRPRRRHTLAYALTILLVLAGVVFGAVTLNALAAASAVDARALDARVEEGERRYAELVAEVAELENPARIREAARELGLVPAPAVRHLAVERNLPADGAPAPTEVGDGGPDPLKPLLSAEPG